MAGLPDKPVLELNQGIEVEGAMDTEKEISGAHRNDPNVKHVEFKSPDIVEYTGEKESPDKEQEEQPVEESEPKSEVDDNLLELRKMMGMETKAEKEAENNTPEETEPAEDQNEDQETEQVEEKEEEVSEDKPKKRLRNSEPAPSYEDMAKLAGQAAAEALKQSNKDSSVNEVPAPEDIGLDEDDKVTYEIFSEMEKSNPNKYKGAKEGFKNFVEKSKEYQRQWLEENPGEEFDPESEEHESFYSQNEPKYSKSDFKKAEKKVEMADVLGEMERKYQERIDELENKISKRTESGPKAREKANEAVQEMVKAISPEMEKVMSEKGLEEAEKFDPLIFDKVSQAADTLSTMVYELEQNQGDGGLFAANSKNENHSAIKQFVEGKENYVKSLPRESQSWEGRSFATNAEYKRMSASEKSRHWTIDANLAKAELIKELTSAVNSEIEQSRKMLERYGAPVAGKKTRAKQNNSTKNPNKPNSPSSNAASAASPNLTTGTDQIKTPEKELAEMLWG